MILLVTAALFIFGIWHSAFRSGCYFTPFNIIAAFNCMLFGGYWILAAVAGSTVEVEITRLVSLGVLAQAVGMLTVRGVALTSTRIQIDRDYDQKFKTAQLFLWITVGIFVLLAIYKVTSKGTFDLYELYSFQEAVTVDFSDTRTRVLGLISRVFSPVFMICIAYTLHAPTARQKLWYYYLPLAVYFLTMFSGYTGRSGIIAMLVALLCAHFTYSRRYQLVTAITGFVAVGILLSALQFVRHGREIESVRSVATSLGDGGEWEAVKLISVIYQNEKNLDVQTSLDRLATEIRNFTINWVPRPLWAGKPDTDFSARTSQEYFGHRYSSELWVRNFTVIGQGYYVGKEFGVISLCFLYGWMVMILVKVLRSYLPFEWFSYYFTFLAAYMFRNAVTTIVFFGLSQILVMYVASRVLGLQANWRRSASQRAIK